ncbi:MAG: alpha/beta hydrolase [Pseudomonadota bacterium]
MTSFPLWRMAEARPGRPAIAQIEKSHSGLFMNRRSGLSVCVHLFAGISLALMLSGCGLGNTTGLLAPPPNLYTFETGAEYPAAAVPETLRRTRSEILYVTDRNPRRDVAGIVADYGDRRSDQMAFGVALVEYGEVDTWDQLVVQTQGGTNAGSTRLDPVYIEELVRFPATPLPYLAGAGRLQATEDARQAYTASVKQMQQEISTRLRRTGLDRVMVYVHGFNNEFDDAVGTLANIWHYTGRQSLPMMYSWPAGSDGPLAYFRDLESGEFSVFHVKEFMRVLSGVPGLERIDIVAHSRGTAVVTTALRELLIEARALGGNPRARMKTGILVLAAADLDLGVVRQRLVAERFADGFEQINIYVNPDDGVLELSRIIGRVSRLGSVNPKELSEQERKDLASANNVSLIIVEGGGTQLGHGYFRENPAVLSDIVLALRTRAAAGSVFRPLEPVALNIYTLHQDYPAEALPAVLDRPAADR